jgi:hypothetical protein
VKKVSPRGDKTDRIGEIILQILSDRRRKLSEEELVAVFKEHGYPYAPPEIWEALSRLVIRKQVELNRETKKYIRAK